MKMVPIDAASRELSIGCHIVYLVKFGPLLENPSCRLDFQAASHFLAPFLTETIWKKSSNQADYTPNR